jgi:hypothetical protein
MSDAEDDTYAKMKANRAHERLDEHESVHDQFDRRISRNENWRLQAQGALKAILLILGSGGIALALDWAIGLF